MLAFALSCRPAGIERAGGRERGGVEVGPIDRARRLRPAAGPVRSGPSASSGPGTTRHASATDRSRRGMRSATALRPPSVPGIDDRIAWLSTSRPSAARQQRGDIGRVVGRVAEARGAKERAQERPRARRDSLRSSAREPRAPFPARCARYRARSRPSRRRPRARRSRPRARRRRSRRSVPARSASTMRAGGVTTERRSRARRSAPAAASQ